MSPAPIPAGSQRGLLMAIGGAEDRAGARRILRHFYTLAGGDDARLVVIPTASEDRQGRGPNAPGYFPVVWRGDR
ncbi:hypothetical protein [Candidatus Amarolinea dominans]|uniref:hypothetical protein n=1 Tax=Candidatus Amarolinea dominans TaxID=3140696 RepID=UPI0031CCBB82